MTAPALERRICEPWCTSHDDEIDRCVSDYRFTSLSLEIPVGETRPKQMQSVLETGQGGQPVIVTFPGDGTGSTLTLTDAMDYIAKLAELVAMGHLRGGDAR